MVWTPAVLGVLYACGLYFCVCACSMHLSVFHLEKRCRNTLMIMIIIITQIVQIRRRFGTQPWMNRHYTVNNFEHRFTAQQRLLKEQQSEIKEQKRMIQELMYAQQQQEHRQTLAQLSPEKQGGGCWGKGGGRAVNKDTVSVLDAYRSCSVSVFLCRNKGTVSVLDVYRSCCVSVGTRVQAVF